MFVLKIAERRGALFYLQKLYYQRGTNELNKWKDFNLDVLVLNKLL